jgi:hypothetical protein
MVKLIYLGRASHLRSFLTQGGRLRFLTHNLSARYDM